MLSKVYVKDVSKNKKWTISIQQHSDRDLEVGITQEYVNFMHPLMDPFCKNLPQNEGRYMLLDGFVIRSTSV
jgi:hypothetical protein